MPSGHVPIDALENPAKFDPNAVNCLIPVPAKILDTIKEHLEEEVGPRAQYLQWYSQDFAVIARATYDGLPERPNLSLQTAWDIFELMDRALSGLII
jgi:hypothetical protein